MFNPAHFTSLTDTVLGHQRFLQEQVLDPILRKLDSHLPKLTQEFASLRASFLGKPPLESREHHIEEDFSLPSPNRELGAQVRRYTLGTQPRGLHARLRQAATPQEHLQGAMSCPHPTKTASRALTPEWYYVFNQIGASFTHFGVKPTIASLIKYRANVRTWLSNLLTFLAPLQAELRRVQPPSCAAVSGHVNSLFFYVILLLSGYSNPRFAFNFWHGAPIVGEFASPALPPARQRENPNPPLSDFGIEQTARKCMASLRTVKQSLTPKAAAKCMKKMKAEFASGTLIGPFDTVEALRQGVQRYIRRIPGFELFVVLLKHLLISAQFSVTEIHAYEEDTASPADSPNESIGSQLTADEGKIRNIWNGKIMNSLALAHSTYVPNTHADLAVIIIQWILLFSRFGFEYSLKGYPADFKSAYRQMPLWPLQILFACSCYFHYEAPNFDHGSVKYAFYTSLPFGSSIAPADWGETCVALAHVMAYVVLAIITHCVDDICGVEMDELVYSSRETFFHIVGLIGLQLDMDKSLTPRADFIYLGLRLLLPCRLTRQVFAIKIPPARRIKLISQLERILLAKSLTSGEASSMRGRLFFYVAWF